MTSSDVVVVRYGRIWSGVDDGVVTLVSHLGELPRASLISPLPLRPLKVRASELLPEALALKVAL